MDPRTEDTTMTATTTTFPNAARIRVRTWDDEVLESFLSWIVDNRAGDSEGGRIILAEVARRAEIRIERAEVAGPYAADWYDSRPITATCDECGRDHDAGDTGGHEDDRGLNL